MSYNFPSPIPWRYALHGGGGMAGNHGLAGLENVICDGFVAFVIGYTTHLTTKLGAIMQQTAFLLSLCLLMGSCASQRTPPPPCASFDDSNIQVLEKTVVPLGLKSTDTTMSFKPNTVTILLRHEDVMSVLKARVERVGYLGEEQRMRGRLTTYPPRAGFSDLSQYSTSKGSVLAESIALELLESGKAAVLDPRASGESLPDVVIFRLANTALRGRAAWREVCSSAGDFILFYLDDVQP